MSKYRLDIEYRNGRHETRYYTDHATASDAFHATMGRDDVESAHLTDCTARYRKPAGDDLVEISPSLAYYDRGPDDEPANSNGEREMHANHIKMFLKDRRGVEMVTTGDKATEEEAGLYYGEADAWIIYGVMPNTDETGWYFAGYTQDLIREIEQECRE